jgi:hypothetical protein
VDQATAARMQNEISEEMDKLFPGEVQRIALLQHSDDPAAEPGEVLVRISMKSSADRRLLGTIGAPHRQAMGKLRDDLAPRFPDATQVTFAYEDGGGRKQRRITMPFDRLAGGSAGAGQFAPVTVRLGPAELETVDALITSGIAANRAEAIRWALARIRERPAFSQLRHHGREIEKLRQQF